MAQAVQRVEVPWQVRQLGLQLMQEPFSRKRPELQEVQLLAVTSQVRQEDVQVMHAFPLRK